METDTDPPAHPTQPAGPPDTRDSIIAQIAASLEQVRQGALQRRLDERDRAAQQAQYASEQEARQRHIDLLKQQQEAATANSNLSQRFSQMELRTEEQSREQARMAESSQGTQIILVDILRKLSELSTNKFIASTPTDPSNQSHPLPAENAPIDWDTPAQQPPAHLRTAQIQYRDRAIYDTVESPLPEDTRATLYKTSSMTSDKSNTEIRNLVTSHTSAQQTSPQTHPG